MHAKSEKLQSFCCKKKGNLLFKKIKESEGKEKFKKKEIMKIKGQTKKGMKKEVNTKRDEQKQEVMKKRTEEKTCKKVKHKKKRKRFSFVNAEEFLKKTG